MKHILLIWVLISFFSCKSKSEKAWNKLQELDVRPAYAERQAYAAYIQSYPKSQRFKTAVSKYLLYDSIYTNIEMPAPFHCRRNCIEIDVNKTGILFKNEPILLNYLADSIAKFYIGKNDITNMPDLYDAISPEGKIREFSRGHLIFTAKNYETDNDELQAVVIEATKGIANYRNHIAETWYGKAYNNLNETRRLFIYSETKHRMYFFKYHEPPPIPPLPK